MLCSKNGILQQLQPEQQNKIVDSFLSVLGCWNNNTQQTTDRKRGDSLQPVCTSLACSSDRARVCFAAWFALAMHHRPKRRLP